MDCLPAPRAPSAAPPTATISTAVRRAFAVGALALALTALATATAPAVRAQTTTPPAVAEADAEVARLRAQADALSARYFAALGDLADLQRRADDLEARIPALEAERARLQALARQRAVVAYLRSGNDLGLVMSADDPLDAARRSQLLARLNDRDAAAAEDLRAATQRLTAQRDQLRTARAQATTALDEVKAQGQQIDQLLAQAVERRNAAVAAATTTTTLAATVATTRPTTSTTVPVAPPSYEPTPGVHPRHDEPFLVCTRARESSGNYRAVNPAGPYLGAYQFLQSTWNSTANHVGRTALIGVSPAAASQYDQDDLAWALFQWQGARPWGGYCDD